MTDTNTMLTFSVGNAKLTGGDTYIFSLPAGHTCPAAEICQSRADKVTGKIIDGPNTQFRCYATLPENLFKNVRESRWKNLELLQKAKTAIGMASLIESALLSKKNIKLVRFHQSGDFFNQEYFDAWFLVAQRHPEWTVYGYTKMLPLWIKRLGSIPSNFKLVASRGGKYDNLIETYHLRSALVVYSQQAAAARGLQVDHDDSHVWNYDKDFAIVIHGTQPAGSEAGKAWYKIAKHGKGGYKSDYFAHYEKHGKSKVKIVTGKHLHVPVVSIKPVSHPKVNGLRAVVIRNKAGRIKIHSPMNG